MDSERIMNFRKGFRIIGFVISGLGTAVIFGLLFGYFVQILWNWLMPSIFSLGKITYWQAFGLVLLSRLIFGTIGHHVTHEAHEHRYHNYEHQARARCHHYWDKGEWEIKGGWKNWKYYDEWWHEEGKASFERYIEQTKNKTENPE